MGIGISPFVNWQSDDKTPNLFDPLVVILPARTDPAVAWDADGWPTSVGSAGYIGWWYPASEGYTKPGRYRLTAKGSGKIWFPHPDIPKDQQAPEFTGHGDEPTVLGEWDLANTATGRVQMGIFKTDPNNHVRDVKFHRVDVDAAGRFTPEYASELSKFRALRMAGYVEVINSQVVDWPKNPDGPFSHAEHWRRSIEICNLAGCDMWANFPHKASDDYIRQAARLVASMLRPGLKVYLEYSIEIWNWGPPFGYATKWVQDWTAANLGPPSLKSYQHGHAWLANHMHNLFAEEAPGVPIVRLICNQHANIALCRQNFEMGASISNFDAIGTAPYVVPLGLDFGRLDALWAGDAASKDAAIRLVFDAYEAGMGSLDHDAQAYAALAKAHGCRLVAYECGPGWQLPNGWPDERKRLFHATYRDPRMEAFLTGRYFPWMSEYFDLAMYTQHTRRADPYEDWGSKYNADDNEAPKHRAVMAWCEKYNGGGGGGGDGGNGGKPAPKGIGRGTRLASMLVRGGLGGGR